MAEAVETAVTELLISGETTMITSRGTVHASLHRSTAAQHGWLYTNYDTTHGPYGTSSARVDDTDDTDLRHQVRTRVAGAVTGLVEG